MIQLLGIMLVWAMCTILVWFVIATCLTILFNQIDPEDKKGNIGVSKMFATILTILILGIVLSHIPL